MYLNYFGLKEPSFSIAPDPEFLYLSQQHREALAHLLYGAGESGGFVLLTGEVGTGKTTVCRAFLEQLPPEVDVALVLNPAVTGYELLRTICDEFRIPVSVDERSTKTLIDRLNQYLLAAHAKGRRPVLMIDEAQNLRPRVLEQVRLLTNLETNKQKLLQIFLVGQPELRRLIDSEALRQLSQRITARFHLGPLTAQETAAYVRHRLAVAGVDRPLFTRRALRRVQALTGGVPRLINLLCDRALLGACVGRHLQVTPRILNRAAKELRGAAGPAWRGPPRPIFTGALILALLFGAGWLARDWVPMPAGSGLEAVVAAWRRDEGASHAVATEPALDVDVGPSESKPVANGAVAVPLETPEMAPSPILSNMGRESALRLLLRRWGVDVDDLGTDDPCRRVAAFGLRCEQEQGTWANLRFFDRPVLLRSIDDEGTDGYLVLSRLRDDRATLDQPDGSIELPVAMLDDDWTGDYLLIWQPPPVGTALIGPTSSGEAVRWLRQLLAQVPDLGFADSGSGRFDDELDQTLRQFQQGRGLVPDGLAGYRTLIQLHNVVGIPGIPRLVEVE